MAISGLMPARPLTMADNDFRLIPKALAASVMVSQGFQAKLLEDFTGMGWVVHNHLKPQ